jgi:peptidoglycan/LPS O-acetylase OafA/YrhL
VQKLPPRCLLVRTKTGRITELDGWRGVSILLVLFQHLALFTFPGALSGSWFNHLAHVSGGLGVHIFFAISGFVITRLFVLEQGEFGSVSLKNFYIRRVCRILPVFYIFLLTVYAFHRTGWTPVDPASFPRAGLFLCDLRFGTQSWFVGHSWSLAVEEQFYLAFPAIWVLFSGRRRSAAIAAGLAITLLWSIAIEWGHLGGKIYLDAISGFSCISVGALLAIFESRAKAIAMRIPSWAFLVTASYLVISPLPAGRMPGTVAVLIKPFAIGLLLIWSMSRKSWAAAALNSPPLQWIGLISYSLYLWQELFTGASRSYGNALIARNFHLGLVALIPVAALSFYFVERPTSRIGRRLTQQTASQRFAA